MIELQKKLIIKKDVELGLVSQTVQKELKTYSSALQQSCSTALSPKNIASAAVKTITKEEDRTKEVVVFGVEEETDECVFFFFLSKIFQIVTQREYNSNVITV